MQRLDKILCDAGEGTRNEVGKLIRRGYVTVDGEVLRKPDLKISEESVIAIDGEIVEKHRTIVCMMNKSAGYVTSTEDPRDLTVMEFLPQNFIKQGVVPVGRLDKDTEGLLLFTNDGNLLHNLISPKNGIPKVYYVEHEGLVTRECIQNALQGITLKDGSVCKSAVITPLEDGKSTIRITEGMYHQVKRMYASQGLKVKFLRRIQVGNLLLGDLPKNSVRELTPEEITRDFQNYLH